MSGKLVVIGGGFAGVWAALGAAHEAIEHEAALDIVLVSADERMTIRPRLYEAHPETLRVPLAPTLEPMGVTLRTGRVTTIDPARKRVSLTDGAGNPAEVAYDGLVLAAGSALRRDVVPGLDRFGFDVDTIDGALRFDRHLAGLVKPNGSAAPATFVVLGAGFTGLELATEMRRRIAIHHGEAAAEAARVLLVDSAESVSGGLGEKPRQPIEAALEEARVEKHAGETVLSVAGDHVLLSGAGRIDTHTVISTLGLAASPLTGCFEAARDDLGRLLVDENLAVPGTEGVYAAGDVAHALADESHAALMSCQHAMPMGKLAGYNAARHLISLSPRAYSQSRYVTCLDLGPAGALFTNGWDRDVVMTGGEAKALKRKIVEDWIVPPRGDRDFLVEVSAIDYQASRS